MCLGEGAKGSADFAKSGGSEVERHVQWTSLPYVSEALLKQSAKPGSLTHCICELEDGLSEVMVYRPLGWPSVKPEAVAYVLHGAGYDGRSLLGIAGRESPMKRLLDNLICGGLIPPMVIACPDWTTVTDVESAPGAIAAVGKTLIALVGHVEDSFGNVAPERRLVCGFSLGGAAAWEAAILAQDLFDWFVPIGSDCWHCGIEGGISHPRETSDAIVTSLSTCSRPRKIMPVCGEDDPSLRAMVSQVNDLCRVHKFDRAGSACLEMNPFIAEGVGHERRLVVDVLAHVLPMAFGSEG